MSNGLIKFVMVVCSLSVLAIGCGEARRVTGDLDIESIDLTANTVVMDVSIPAGLSLPQGYQMEGIKSEDFELFFPYPEVDNIYMIMIDRTGTRHLIALDSVHDQTTIDGVTYPRIWLSDRQNSERYLANVAFGESAMRVTINLVEGPPSESFSEVYVPGDTSARFYLHFERK